MKKALWAALIGQSLLMILLAVITLRSAGPVPVSDAVREVGEFLARVAWPVIVLAIFTMLRHPITLFIAEMAEVTFPGGSAKRGDARARQLRDQTTAIEEEPSISVGPSGMKMDIGSVIRNSSGSAGSNGEVPSQGAGSVVDREPHEAKGAATSPVESDQTVITDSAEPTRVPRRLGAEDGTTVRRFEIDRAINTALHRLSLAAAEGRSPLSQAQRAYSAAAEFERAITRLPTTALPRHRHSKMLKMGVPAQLLDISHDLTTFSKELKKGTAELTAAGARDYRDSVESYIHNLARWAMLNADVDEWSVR